MKQSSASPQSGAPDTWAHASHICLVSGQLLPNLIPALMLKPPQVHLVVTADMKAQAQRLHSLLQRHGIECRQHTGAPSTNVGELRNFALELAGELDGEPLLLNATGGTKLMALAFAQVFTEVAPETRVFYTDTEHGVLEFLAGEASTTEPIRSVLDLDTYLRAQGLRRERAASRDDEWLERARRRKPLTKQLAAQCGGHQGFIGALNSAVEETLKDGGFRNPQCLAARNSSQAKLREAIARPEYDLLDIISADTVSFRSREAAKYLGGGWMEEYGYWILRDADIEHVESGAEVIWLDSRKEFRPPNELDVVAVHRNKLLLIECKTARSGRNSVKDQDILNRLESLGRNAGGLFGKAVLLSGRQLSDEARNRANAYRIAWFDCTNLKEFRTFVENWMTR